MSESLVIYPAGIEATKQKVAGGKSGTTILAEFEKITVVNAIPNGDVELQVTGKLTSGQYFIGTGSVKIIHR